jgi:hypothetical protein
MHAIIPPAVCTRWICFICRLVVPLIDLFPFLKKVITDMHKRPQGKLIGNVVPGRVHCRVGSALPVPLHLHLHAIYRARTTYRNEYRHGNLLHARWRIGDRRACAWCCMHANEQTILLVLVDPIHYGLRPAGPCSTSYAVVTCVFYVRALLGAKRPHHYLHDTHVMSPAAGWLLHVWLALAGRG